MAAQERPSTRIALLMSVSEAPMPPCSTGTIDGEDPLILQGRDRLRGEAGIEIDVVGGRTGHRVGDALSDFCQSFAG